MRPGGQVLPYQQLRGLGEEATTAAMLPSGSDVASGDLATAMVLRGAAGVLLGAAVAPVGREGVWAAAGFVSGAVLGQIGIVGLAMIALWRKTER